MEFSDNDIVGDPALRKPIEEYPISTRDEVIRRYLVKVHVNHMDMNFL